MSFELVINKQNENGRLFSLNLGRTSSVVTCWILVFLCLERIYMPGKTSGSFNGLIYGLFLVLAFGLLMLNMSKVSYGLRDLVFVFVAMYFLFWHYDSRSLQYAIIVLTVLFIGKLNIDDMLVLHRALVGLGLIFSIVFCIGEERWSGFLNNSAPVFSLIMVTSMAYLLFHPNSKVIDYCLALIALFLIFMTETRITLLVGLVLLVARFFNGPSKKIINFFIRHKLLLFIVLTIVVWFVFLNYDLLLSIISRSNGDASSETRIGLMQGVCAQWLQSASSLIFGNKGGFAMHYVALLDPAISGNMPVHQDVLMLLCDYGCLGFLLFVFAFSSFAMKWPWYAFLILAMATFHNVFTAGVSFLLLILSFNSLANILAMGRATNV